MRKSSHIEMMNEKRSRSMAYVYFKGGNSRAKEEIHLAVHEFNVGSFLLEAAEVSLCYFFENWLMKLKCPNLRNKQIKTVLK